MSVCFAQAIDIIGLTIEQVLPGSPAERAGLRAGDTLLDWTLEPRTAADQTLVTHALASPFDIQRIEIEHAPRGTVVLSVKRDESTLTVRMNAIQWGVRAEPMLRDEALARYRDGVAARADQDGNVAAAIWVELADSLQREGDQGNAAWMLALAAELVGATEVGNAHFQRALSLADQLDSDLPALLHAARAQSLERSGNSVAAESAWQSALDTRRRAESQPGLGQAHALYMLGSLKGRMGDFVVTDDLLREAHEIVVAHAPASLLDAQIEISLGIGAAMRGDLDTGATRFRRALEIALAVDPDSGDVGAALNALGNVAQRRGRLAEAEDYYRAALEISERIEHGSLNSSLQLNNLGFIAELRGDLAGAEDYYRRSLAIRRERAQGTLYLPRAIENLGFVAFLRGDLAAAEAWHQEALPLYEALAPGSLVVANSLKLIANVNLERGELDEAEAYFERTRELEHAVAPDTGSYAEILHGLARVAERRGDLDRAKPLYEEALAMRERIAPGGLEEAESLAALGALAHTRQDYRVAEEYFVAATDIRSLLAPGTAELADTLHALGDIYKATGRTQDALGRFEAAIAAIEMHRGRLGGTDVVRSRFAARYGRLYKDTIALLVELDRPDDAFAVLERYRARGLLAMLAERDLLLDKDLPEELAQRRLALNAEYDDATMQLRWLANTPGLAGEIHAIRARLNILQDERAQLAQAIRAISPRLASAESPEPLTLAGAHRELPAGTTLLSYAIGDERSWLFALHKITDDAGPQLHVYTIDLGADALAAEVSALRVLLQAPGAGETSYRALLTRANALYRTLIEPAQALVTGGERLLIVPDGPLHQLAFAALVTNDSDIERLRPRYLIEDRPIHTAVSATVYSELLRDGLAPARPDATLRLVAFADPLAPAGASDTNGLVAALLRGQSLGPLPYARREVDSIARLVRGTTQVHVGPEASESRAKSIGLGPRAIHYASHAVVDTAFPLDSWLLLTPSVDNDGPAENGLLQAWEIFEQIRIDADLVTLSACDTGLGGDGGGEGLIGLTRAFQYAGARAVLASLWPVADRSTSALMQAFYAGYEGGMAKDEALRAAQLTLIGTAESRGLIATIRSWLNFSEAPITGEISHPFHWAAFQLSGDPH